jgi:hypothetical protein
MNIAKSGRMVKLPICWAVRTSLTLEDTITMNSTHSMHARGTARSRINNVFRSGIVVSRAAIRGSVRNPHESARPGIYRGRASSSESIGTLEALMFALAVDMGCDR